MRIAFYAPLKAPDHPIASGDRRMGQLLLAALRSAGHDAFIASRFRSYDGRGDRQRQVRLAALGARLARRFLRRCQAAPQTRPELWFTYHLYHKAPDWLGPAIADALDIPYIVAEASDAPKQADGCWSAGRQAAMIAIRRADAVIGLNRADRDCVLPLLQGASRWVPLNPFVDASCYAAAPRSGDGPVRLIVVAMMRYGDKLASYRLLGDALTRLLDLPWMLEVIGDGGARTEVEAALAPLGERAVWRGRLDAEAVSARLAAADICVWPALNEAFGMALLEAQASGLPVVAGQSGGVGGIIADGVTGLLVPPGNAAAFAAAARSLILDGRRRAAFGQAAQQRVRAQHDIAVAARRLQTVIGALRER